MWMPDAPDEFNVMLARQNVLFAFRTRLLFLGSTEDLDLLNGYSAVALAAQTCLGHFNSTGEGADVYGRATPAALNAMCMMPLILWNCVQKKVPPIVLNDEQHEDSHVDAVYEAQFGDAKGGGNPNASEGSLLEHLCTNMDDSLFLIRRMQSMSQSRGLGHLEEKVNKKARKLVDTLLKDFGTGDSAGGLRAFPFTGNNVYTGEEGQPPWWLRQHELPAEETHLGATLKERIALNAHAHTRIDKEIKLNRRPPVTVREPLIDKVEFQRGGESPAQKCIPRLSSMAKVQQIEFSYQPHKDCLVLAMLKVQGGQPDSRTQYEMELAAIVKHSCEKLDTRAGHDPEGTHYVDCKVPDGWVHPDPLLLTCTITSGGVNYQYHNAALKGVNQATHKGISAGACIRVQCQVANGKLENRPGYLCVVAEPVIELDDKGKDIDDDGSEGEVEVEYEAPAEATAPSTATSTPPVVTTGDGDPKPRSLMDPIVLTSNDCGYKLTLDRCHPGKPKTGQVPPAPAPPVFSFLRKLI